MGKTTCGNKKKSVLMLKATCGVEKKTERMRVRVVR